MACTPNVFASNSTVRDCGGPLDVNSISENLRNIASAVVNDCRHIIKYCESSLPSEKRADIYFELVATDEFKAFAFEEGDDEYVAVSFGVPLLFYEVFCFLFANPEILAFVGNAQAEVFSDLHLERLSLSFPNWYRGGLCGITPKDNARRIFARHLAEVALWFILFHEIGHLRQGHVKLLRAMHENQTAYRELEDYQFLTRQTLEMDADSYAIYQIMLLASRMPTTEKLHPELAPFFASKKSCFLLYLFAVSVTVRLQDDQQCDFMKPNQNHPPLPMRLMMWTSTAFANNQILNLMSREDFLETVNSASAEADKIAQIITGKPALNRGLLRATEPDANERATKFLQHWKVVRPHLLPFARSGIAP